MDVPVGQYRHLLRVLAGICILAATLCAQGTPGNMTRLAVRLETPDVPPESFAAKPKLMYRAGTGHCCTEELPDPEQGIRGLMIINEPDVW